MYNIIPVLCYYPTDGSQDSGDINNQSLDNDKGVYKHRYNT